MILVCPPFQHADLSSLSVAHLATFLHENGVDCAEAYPHLEFARIVGIGTYLQVATLWDLSGELLFAEGLHGEPSATKARTDLMLFGDAARREEIRRQFLDRCLPTIMAGGTDIVGFTTSFHQLMSSLWLAKEIKSRSPSTIIVLGGASCREPMGEQILRGYPQVDYVVSGFGEMPLLALARGQRPTAQLIRNYEYVDLDAMPIPNYDAYLRCARHFNLSEKLALTFESSRGCWWGQKNHCKFCGINGQALHYSAKSTARTVEQIRALWERYGLNLFATDAIMPISNLDELMSELGRYEDRPKLFYELKSTLTESQVIALARARVQGQPGLESLSTRLLGLMGKGGSAIRNLAFLKWCRERGMPIAWNQLYSVPGERVADYEQQIALMKSIVQFPPPERAAPIVVTRFSPYFDSYRAFGWSNLSPRLEYESMHPHLAPEQLYQIAANFSGTGGPDPSEYAERFVASVKDWQVRNARGEGLFLDPVAGLVRNEDGSGQSYLMSPFLARVLDCTHVVAPIQRVLETAKCEYSFLEQMEKLGLLYIEGSKALNLSIRLGLR